jgi:excisionase family DNA binding protein
MSPGLEDEYLTVNEIAQRLKLNPQTLRNWIEQGKLPALRVGRRVRIRRADFERLLQEGFTGSARDTPAQPGEPTAEDFWSGEPVGNVQAPPTDQAPTHEPEQEGHQ